MKEKDILEKFVEIMGRKENDIYFDHPSQTYNSAFGGGDCEKHGRFYGICHSCAKERKNFYEDHAREFEYIRIRDLKDLAREAQKFI